MSQGGNSLVVQWLGLGAFTRAQGSTPSQRTKIPQKEKVVKKSQCENEIKKVK